MSISDMKTMSRVRNATLVSELGNRSAQIDIKLLSLCLRNYGVKRLRTNLPGPVPVQRVVVSRCLLSNREPPRLQKRKQLVNEIPIEGRHHRCGSQPRL